MFFKIKQSLHQIFLKTLGYNNCNVIYNLSKSIDKLQLEWNHLEWNGKKFLIIKVFYYYKSIFSNYLSFAICNNLFVHYFSLYLL